MDLFPDFADLLEAFARHGVRYLLIGGYAVAVHATPRYTKDLDLWLSDTPANREATAAALTEFGAPLSVVEDMRRSTSADVVWFGLPPVRIDLIQRIGGMDFEAVWRRRKQVAVGRLQIDVINLADLMEAKRTAGRPQDLADLDVLRRVEESSSEP